MRLNQNKAYGKISGEPYIPRGCSTAAFYEQDGRFFDQYFEEIVPGNGKQIVSTVKSEADRAMPSPKKAAPAVEAKAEAEAEEQPEPAENAGPSLTADQLLAQSSVVPWAQFQKLAKQVLGQKCPAGRDAIMNALRRASVETSEPVGAARSSQEAPQARQATQAREAAQAPTSDGPVDLAAWGMGKTNFLFGAVRKAIREQHGRAVENKKDAVDFLIEAKVIPGHLARKDFEPGRS